MVKYKLHFLPYLTLWFIHYRNPVEDSSVCSLIIPTSSRLGNLFKRENFNGQR